MPVLSSQSGGERGPFFLAETFLGASADDWEVCPRSKSGRARKAENQFQIESVCVVGSSAVHKD
jgi:hypothetical protein